MKEYKVYSIPIIGYGPVGDLELPEGLKVLLSEGWSIESSNMGGIYKDCFHGGMVREYVQVLTKELT